MQVNFTNPSKFSIKNHPNYRLVKVSDRQGTVGFVLPHANVVVPDRRTIRDLSDLIKFYTELSAQSFEKPIEYNKIDDLPLFREQ